MKASHHYVGRRPAIVFLVAAFFGWLLWRAMLFAADVGARIERDFAGASWSDVIGSLLVLPIAILLFVALVCGRQATLQLLALVGLL